MANYYTTALPTVGVTIGPTWASTLNTVITLIENHNHNSDDQQKITPAAISLNANLNFGSTGLYYAPTNQAYSQFKNQTLPSPASAPVALAVDASGNLWYNNNAAQAIQLTTGGTIVSTGTGANQGFYGDYAANSAGVYYKNSSGTYYFGTAGTTAGGSGGTLYANAATLAASAPTLLFTSAPASFLASTTDFYKFQAPATGSLAGYSSGGGSTANIASVYAFAKSKLTSYYETWFGINARSADAGTLAAPLAPLHVATGTLGGSTYNEIMRLTPVVTSQTGFAVPTQGFGTYITFCAPNTSTANIASTTNQARIGGSWQNTTTSNLGNLSLDVWNNSAWAKGIEIAHNSANVQIGLGGPASNAAAVTTSYPIYPGTDNSTDLGSAALRFRTTYSNTINLSAVGDTGGNAVFTLSANQIVFGTSFLTLRSITAGGSGTLGTISNPWAEIRVRDSAFTNTPTKGAALASSVFTPANAADLTVRHAGNNILAYGKFTSGASPTIQGTSWNFASVSRTYSSGTTQQYTINLNQGINNGAALIATAESSSTAGGTYTQIVWVNSTQLLLLTNDQGGAAATAVNFVAIGLPNGTI